MKLRWLQLAATMVLVHCGGKAHSPDAAAAGSGGLAGVPTISVPPDAGMSSGGAGVGSAPETSCLPEVLWVAIVDGALGGLGSCNLTSVPGAGEKIGRLRGAVLLDSDGRVIDNTGLSGLEKQTWLDKLGNQRWLCLAGQTLGYTCKPAA